MLMLLLAHFLSCLVIKGCMLRFVNSPVRVQMFLSQLLPLYFRNRLMWVGLSIIVIRLSMLNEVSLVIRLHKIDFR